MWLGIWLRMAIKCPLLAQKFDQWNRSWIQTSNYGVSGSTVQILSCMQKKEIGKDLKQAQLLTVSGRACERRRVSVASLDRLKKASRATKISNRSSNWQKGRICHVVKSPNFPDLTGGPLSISGIGGGDPLCLSRRLFVPISLLYKELMAEWGEESSKMWPMMPCNDEDSFHPNIRLRSWKKPYWRSMQLRRRKMVQWEEKVGIQDLILRRDEKSRLTSGNGSF